MPAYACVHGFPSGCAAILGRGWRSASTDTYSNSPHARPHFNIMSFRFLTCTIGDYAIAPEPG